MKKLLHERLRDSKGAIETLDGKVIILFNIEAQALADEIERYYKPLPRYEDGEPVQFGDEVEGCEGYVNSMLLFDDGTGTIYGKDDNCFPAKECGADIYIGGEGVKRPSHKVLDADGVEIKVGDAVYDLKGLYNTPLEVLEIREKSIKVSIPDGKGYTAFTPENLTHKEPVLDADGVPIKVGDTVYRTDPPIQQSVVVNIERYYPEGHVEIKCSENNGQVTALYSPSLLTHKEPDSLKKLRDDMRSFGEVGADCTSDCCLQYADRLSALIEKVN